MNELYIVWVVGQTVINFFNKCLICTKAHNEVDFHMLLFKEAIKLFEAIEI